MQHADALFEIGLLQFDLGTAQAGLVVEIDGDALPRDDLVVDQGDHVGDQ